MTRRIVAITLSVLAVALVWGQETTTRRLTPDEVKVLISGSEEFFFLDVRDPKDLEELGTIRGYVNVPRGESDGCP